jgi:hypothetical protein
VTNSLSFTVETAFIDGRIALASIDDLADVDTSTTPPVDNAVLTFDTADNLWKPTERLSVPIIIACSDETTAITVGAGKATFRMPYALTLTEVRASATTAPTGAAILIDINENGASILSTKLMIDATEKTSTTAATPYAFSDTALADDSEITIDFDQVGSTIAGAGIKVTLIGVRP